MVKRDKRGRVIQRVDGQYSDRIYSVRLTAREYSLIETAKQRGVDVRALLVDTLQKKLEVTNDAKT